MASLYGKREYGKWRYSRGGVETVARQPSAAVSAQSRTARTVSPGARQPSAAASAGLRASVRRQAGARTSAATSAGVRSASVFKSVVLGERHGLSVSAMAHLAGKIIAAGPRPMAAAATPLVRAGRLLWENDAPAAGVWQDKPPPVSAWANAPQAGGMWQNDAWRQ